MFGEKNKWIKETPLSGNNTRTKHPKQVGDMQVPCALAYWEAKCGFCCFVGVCTFFLDNLTLDSEFAVLAPINPL